MFAGLRQTLRCGKAQVLVLEAVAAAEPQPLEPLELLEEESHHPYLALAALAVEELQEA